MCLLVRQYKDTELSDELLAGVFAKNRDGIGVMWAENGVLYTHKALPNNVEQFIKFYHDYIEGKDCCWHARMRTHGDIDLENCHPYTVLGDGSKMPISLMHNGTLHHGNAADTSMSDTWHYIQDFLVPIATRSPDILFTPEFSALLAAHIGSNRFAMMNHKGETILVNQKQGVEYAGAWFSNTYAWEYRKFVPVTTTYGGHGAYGSWWKDYYDTDAYFPNVHRPANVHNLHAKHHTKTPQVKYPKGAVTTTTTPRKTGNKLFDDAQDLYAEIAYFDSALAGGITVKQVEGLVERIGSRDAWDLLDMFIAKKISPGELTRVIQDPRRYADLSFEDTQKDLDFTLPDFAADSGIVLM